MQGKLISKKHIRMTEEMAREIELLADLERRNFQDQARVLCELGLQVYRQQGNAANAGKRRLLSAVDSRRRTEGVA